MHSPWFGYVRSAPPQWACSGHTRKNMPYTNSRSSDSQEDKEKREEKREDTQGRTDQDSGGPGRQDGSQNIAQLGLKQQANALLACDEVRAVKSLGKEVALVDLGVCFDDSNVAVRVAFFGRKLLEPSEGGLELTRQIDSASPGSSPWQ